MNRTAQPVAALTCSRVTPGCSATTTSSQVSGSGSITARSVMTHFGPPPRRPNRSRSPLPSPIPDRGAEVATLDERPCRLAHDHHHRAGRRGDLRSPAGAGQPRLRRFVRADHGRVDVGVLVELRAAEEPDVDPPGLQPVGEDLRNADDRIAGLGELAVTDRQRQSRRLGADAARLVDQHRLDRVQPAGEVGGRRRQADADEALAACPPRRARRAAVRR